jgi:hypothetical protein
MALGFLLAMPASAQVDFDDWVGEWFKGPLKQKGLAVAPMETDKAAEKINSYSYVQSWDGGTQIMTVLSIEQDASGTWLPPVPRIVQILNGNALDSVGYSLVPPGAVMGVELVAAVVSLTGKEKNGELTKAKIKSLGGCLVYDQGASYLASGLDINQKGVAEDKVPQEVKDLIP